MGVEGKGVGVRAGRGYVSAYYRWGEGRYVTTKYKREVAGGGC